MIFCKYLGLDVGTTAINRRCLVHYVIVSNISRYGKPGSCIFWSCDHTSEPSILADRTSVTANCGPDYLVINKSELSLAIYTVVR